MLRRCSGANRLLALLSALTALLLTAAPPSHAQGGTGFTWVHTLTPPGPNPMGQAARVAMDSQGNVIAVGQVNEFDVGQLFTVAKFDPAGNLVWQRTLGLGVAQAVVVDRGDNIIAGGYVFTSGPNNSLVAKWDPQGNLLWRGTLETDPRIPSSILALALDSSNNVIAGGGIGPNSSGDWAVAKFQAADGTRLWLRRGGPFTGPTDDFIEAVTVDANNDVAAAGFTGTPSTGFQFLVLKIDGADGSLLWLQEQGTAAPNQFN